MGLRISYPPRRNHSFGVCALGRFGTTIRLSLSWAPLFPLQGRRPGFSLALAGGPGPIGATRSGFRADVNFVLTAF